MVRDTLHQRSERVPAAHRQRSKSRVQWHDLQGAISTLQHAQRVPLGRPFELLSLYGQKQVSPYRPVLALLPQSQWPHRREERFPLVYNLPDDAYQLSVIAAAFMYV